MQKGSCKRLCPSLDSRVLLQRPSLRPCQACPVFVTGLRGLRGERHQQVMSRSSLVCSQPGIRSQVPTTGSACLGVALCSPRHLAFSRCR